ncbi:MAG: DUF2461 domain-containing protein [Bacteroidota bacterium]|nr:DUF2461 domain-containing protein [Bacteroidota bacterium]MDE2955668.1 DUF2461 domain-containing protein [Bacteroidota bacterium]
MFITPELFTFFRELAENNDRAWFAENRSRYERYVKVPLLEFIRAFATPLHSLSPNYSAVPRVGGSLFRIYRDIRFSKDKSPFKTAAGIHFRHNAGKDAHAPGFYLHLEPDEVFAAIGIWGPRGPALRSIRQFIADHADEWTQILSDPAFTEVYHRNLATDALKRAPKGFDPNHPLIEDLKRKHFVAAAPLTESAVCSDDFPEHLYAVWNCGTDYMSYLTRAVNLPW